MSNVTENEQFESQKEFDVRVEKVKRLEKAGVFPYAAKFKRTHKIAQAKELKEGAELSVCGRLISSRIMGKILFGHIYDIDAKIQVVISMDECPEGFEFYKEYIDVADFIGVTGKMFVTKAGELSVRVSKLTLLSKALRPLPEKFHGITDTDTIYRQRYLDLIANEKSRQTFRTRLAVIKTIRDYLTSNGFTEVETPILQNVASGAVARPFKTKHNALNKDYYLRIAPELYLKQVVAGGFDRVFELGKNFRNEGMDASHLQEFTMLEWYAAYWDYKDNIDFSVSMIQKIVKEVKGNLVVEYQGKKFDFTKVAYMDYTAELNHITGKDILTISFAELKKHLLSTKMFSAEDFKELHSMPALVDFVFKKKLR
ncbi:MAG: OB-fold nucleic acid binding domain-containing protein, partial [Firmicutes bacterium]|nr:OB-fold nucleic acid binding domain-containing protein [Bacillota bacterium]